MEQNDVQKTIPSSCLLFFGTAFSLFFVMYKAKEVIYDFPWLIDIKNF